MPEAVDKQTNAAGFLRGQSSASCRSDRRPQGFVLLIVVITLAIACILFYQLATLSFAKIREVIEDERELRQRWTLVSFRRAMLPRANDLQGRIERGLNSGRSGSSSGNTQIVRATQEVIKINGQAVEFRVEDESAKLKLPALLEERPEQEASRIVGRLMARSRAFVKREIFVGGERPSVWNWYDIFEEEALSGRELLRATDAMTLWGDGRLNVMRADQTVLDEAWRSVFGHLPPRELIDARQGYPRDSWKDLRERLSLRQSQLKLADRWFTGTSSCYSLELRVLNSASDASKTWLFVRDRNVGNYGFEL